MPSTGLKGSYPLSEEKINTEVTKTSAGAYALGNVADDTFYVEYVGRSDSDINSRLQQHVGKYKRFKYDYYASPKATFE